MDTHDPPKIQPVATIEAGEEIPERSCGLYLSGDDLLYGDNDNDTLVGGSGPDYFEGSFGDDVAYYDPAPTTGGESSDTFLDGSCEILDDIVN